MTAILFFGVLILVVIIFALRVGQGKKRGCGRGCATCGNRFICHPGEYDEDGNSPDAKQSK